MQAGPAPGWVAALFPTDGADEREQRLAVLLEAEFAGGPMLSAQFRSRILTLASPTAEDRAAPGSGSAAQDLGHQENYQTLACTRSRLDCRVNCETCRSLKGSNET